MKKIITAIVLVSITSYSFGAKIRVNNIPGVNADYTSLSAAITAAASGDTIYLEPSPTTYGNATIGKKLTIIGNGNFYNGAGLKTMNPGLQSYMENSTVNTLDIQAGGDSSLITGLDITYLRILASEIYITSNKIHTISLGNYNHLTTAYSNVANIYIRKNIIWYALNTYLANFSSHTVSNVNFFNNIFPYTAGSNFVLPVGISGNIAHNYISPFYSLSTYSFSYYNNIMHNGTFAANNNVYYNNISTGAQFGTTNGNQSNVSLASLFVYPTVAADSQLVLANPGPGVGTGFGGANIGPMGGPSPYRLSCIPAFPTIYQLTAPPATTTNTLPVTISTRSNN